MKTRMFDCLEMKRRGSLRIYEEIKDLSPEEKFLYWKKWSEKMLDRKRSLKDRMIKQRA